MGQIEWQKKIIKEEYIEPFSSVKERKEQDFYKSLRNRKQKSFPNSLTNPLYRKKL